MKILAICTVLLHRECLFFFPSSASSLGLIEILALFLFGIYPVLHPQRGSNSGFWSRPSRSLMLWSEGIFRCVCIIKVISNDSLIKKWLSPCIYTFPSLKSLNFNTLMVLHGLFTTIQSLPSDPSQSARSSIHLKFYHRCLASSIIPTTVFLK